MQQEQDAMYSFVAGATQRHTHRNTLRETENRSKDNIESVFAGCIEVYMYIRKTLTPTAALAPVTYCRIRVEGIIKIRQYQQLQPPQRFYEINQCKL